MGDRETLEFKVIGMCRSDGIITMSGRIKDDKYFSFRVADNDRSIKMLIDVFGVSTEEDLMNLMYKDISETITLIRTAWLEPVAYYTYGTFVGKSGEKYHLIDCYNPI